MQVNYFSLDEIVSLLKKHEWHPPPGIEETPFDRWQGLNVSRQRTLSSLNCAISEVVSKNIRENLPIIEIGSGGVYQLLSPLSHNLVKTQPRDEDICFTKQFDSSPIYQLDVKALFNLLSKDDKKISLFFGVNVFDAMSRDSLRENLLYLSQLQAVGDKILAISDIHPLINESLEELMQLYPDYEMHPYFPSHYDPNRCYIEEAVLLRPCGYSPRYSSLMECILSWKANRENVLKLIQDHELSPSQERLHRERAKHQWPVVNISELFIEKITRYFKELGYTSKVYRHASFTVGFQNGTIAEQCEVIYNTVMPIAFAPNGEWSLKDKKFSTFLSKRGVILQEEYLNYEFRKPDQPREVLLGAEILVIEATKSS